MTVFLEIDYTMESEDGLELMNRGFVTHTMNVYDALNIFLSVNPVEAYYEHLQRLKGRGFEVVPMWNRNIKLGHVIDATTQRVLEARSSFKIPLARICSAF